MSGPRPQLNSAASITSLTPPHQAHAAFLPGASLAWPHASSPRPALLVVPGQEVL